MIRSSCQGHALTPETTGGRQNQAILPKKRIGTGGYGGGTFLCLLCGKTLTSRFGTYLCAPLYLSVAEDLNMLVERGLQVMNVEAVGEAYAIASNYLRRTGAIADTLATNERLLGIIVQLFQRGEFNKIRLANKAIAKFEAETLIA
jgi:hypothetical protein